jgi:hypothetical protein
MDAKKDKNFILSSKNPRGHNRLSHKLGYGANKQPRIYLFSPQSSPNIIKFVDHALIKCTKLTASFSNYSSPWGKRFEPFLQGSAELKAFLKCTLLSVSR